MRERSSFDPNRWFDLTVDEKEEILRKLDGAEDVLRGFARSDPRIFNEVVLEDEQTGAPIWNAPIHLEIHDAIDSGDNVIIWAPIESGKAVPLDTEIPTPDGWRTMGDLVVGDFVFGSNGKPCSVVWTSPVMTGRECFRVTFDDGVSVVADADHQWLARSAWPRAEPSRSMSGDGPLCACGCGLGVAWNKTRSRWNTYIHCHHGRKPRWEVVTTRQMLDGGLQRRGGGKKKDGSPYHINLWRIPLAGPVEYPERDLPIHPYVLGAWLGDGHSSGPRFTCAEADIAIVKRCIDLEGGRGTRQVDSAPGVTVWNIGGAGRWSKDDTTLKRRLKRLGLIGNKHIPPAYLTASIEQRRELLAGLLDTDGTVSRAGGNSSTVEFSSKWEHIAISVLELVRSLGFKARLRNDPARIAGRDCGRRYRVFFTAREPVFWIERKRAKQLKGWLHGKSRCRSVVAIESEPSVPVKCIQVDSPDSTYLLGRSYTVTHNTAQCSIGRVLYAWGMHPTTRVLHGSKRQQNSFKVGDALRRYIERSERLHAIFPGLRRGEKWTTEAFRIAGASLSAKDNSWEGIGDEGNCLGARYDLEVLDDLLDFENTYTPERCRKTLQWLRTNVFSRRAKPLRDRRGKIIRTTKTWLLANVMEEDDAAHVLSQERGWKAHRISILDEDGNSKWEDVWPLDRIDDWPEAQKEKQLFCRSRARSERSFPEEYILSAKEAGVGCRLMPTFRLTRDQVTAGYRIVHGYDLASRKKRKSDRTSRVTLLLHPDGRMQILSVMARRLHAPEIRADILHAWEAYGGIFVVEDNAAQDYIRQLMAVDFPEIPIRPFTTTAIKGHPEYGVAGLASEMAAGQLLIPNDDGECHPEVEALLQNMRDYMPLEHPGDRLMALWFAREGCRRKRFDYRIDSAAHGDMPPEMMEPERPQGLDPAADHLWQDLREVFGEET